MGLLLGALFNGASEVETAGRVYYVSPSGNDSNDGLSLEEPFLTIGHARDVVAAYKVSPGLPTGGILIYLRGGTYQQTECLRLTGSEHSGSANKPIVYKSYQNEIVKIGGKVISSNQATLVTSGDAIWSRISAEARGNLYKIDLVDQGLSIGDYGTISELFDENYNRAPLELFINSNRQILPQYPKKTALDAGTWSTFGSALSGGDITYTDNRSENWINETDAWAMGFFNYEYAVEVGKITNINTSTNKFSMQEVTYDAIANGAKYFVRNVLEELTEPGEYYLHQSSGILYFWPEEGVTVSSAEIKVSMNEGFYGDVALLYGVSYVQFKGLILECGRRSAFHVDNLCNNIVLDDCILRNCGTDGANLYGDTMILSRNEIYDVGAHGIRAQSLLSDRAMLTDCQFDIYNNILHDCGYWFPTRKNCVSLECVGVHFVKNTLYNAESPMIFIRRNNNMVQFNEIHHACKWAEDSGAIYTGGTWKHRGHIIRWNYIHDIICALGSDASGVYIDDVTSDVICVGNLIVDVGQYGVRLSGGRGVKITSNCVINAGVASFQYDNRAVRYVDDVSGSAWNLLERLTDDGVSYQTGIWASTYPNLAEIPNSYATISVDSNGWTQPHGSVISRNITYNCPQLASHYDYDGVTVEMESVADNVEDTDPLLVYKSASLYASNSPVFNISGFIDFPFGEVGYASFLPILTNDTYYNVYDATF